MRFCSKRCRAWLLIGFALLLLMTAGLHLAAQPLLSLLNRYYLQQYAVTVKAEEIDFNLFFGDINFRNLVYSYQSKPRIKINEAHLQVNPKSAIFGDLYLSEADIKGLKITLSDEPLGGLGNFEFDENEQKSSVNVKVDRFRIADTLVEVNTENNKFEARLPDVEFSDYDSRRDNTIKHRIKALLDDSSLSFNGVFDLATQTIDADLDLESLDLHRAMGWLPRNFQLDGLVTLKGHFTGGFEQLTFEGALEAKKFVFDNQAHRVDLESLQSDAIKLEYGGSEGLDLHTAQAKVNGVSWHRFKAPRQRKKGQGSATSDASKQEQKRVQAGVNTNPAPFGLLKRIAALSYTDTIYQDGLHQSEPVLTYAEKALEQSAATPYTDTESHRVAKTIPPPPTTTEGKLTLDEEIAVAGKQATLTNLGLSIPVENPEKLTFRAKAQLQQPELTLPTISLRAKMLAGDVDHQGEKAQVLLDIAGDALNLRQGELAVQSAKTHFDGQVVFGDNIAVTGTGMLSDAGVEQTPLSLQFKQVNFGRLALENSGDSTSIDATDIGIDQFQFENGGQALQAEHISVNGKGGFGNVLDLGGNLDVSGLASGERLRVANLKVPAFRIDTNLIDLGAIELTGADALIIQDNEGWQLPYQAPQVVHPERPVGSGSNEQNRKHFHIESVQVTGKSMLRIHDLKVNPNFIVDMLITQASLGPIDSRDKNKETAVKLVLNPDKYSKADFSGSIKPLLEEPQVDLKGSVTGLAMSDLQGYLTEVLGYKMNSGRLHNQFKLKINNGSIDMSNKIQIRKLSVAPIPDKQGLPLGIALPLMKDSSGHLNLNMPIKGKLSDPKFSVSSIITKTITKAVTLSAGLAGQPVGALWVIGGMLKAKLSEIPPIDFATQSDVLDKEQKQALTKLAKKLTRKKSQRLLVCGTASKEEAETNKLVALELASRRAQQTISYLITTGIKEEQLQLCKPEIGGKGQSQVIFDFVAATPEEKNQPPVKQEQGSSSSKADPAEKEDKLQ